MAINNLWQGSTPATPLLLLADISAIIDHNAIVGNLLQ
jgi:hypothetical protein